MKIFLQLLRFYYTLKKRFGKPKASYVWNRADFYKNMWEEAAHKLSAQFLDHKNNFWQIKKGKCQTWIKLHLVEFDNPVKLNIAGDKALSYKLMSEIDLPVPEHLVFSLDQISLMKSFIKKHPGYFVIKPASGTSAGLGVTTHICSYKKCIKAAVLASLYCEKIIIEKLIPGECYRLLFLNGEMIHASRRAGIKIKGDGKSSVRKLIENKFGVKKRITKNRDYLATVAAQNLTSASIIEKNKDVLVKSINNFSNKHSEIRTEYNEDVTNLVCSEIVEEGKKAVSTVNSKFIGVDIITLNIQLPLKETGGVINEINTTPGLHHHFNLKGSGPNNTAVKVLDYLLKKQQ